MKRTSVTAATAPLVLLQTALPSAIGLAAFGDSVRDGWTPVAIGAFLVALVSSVVLCGAEVQLELIDSDDVEEPDHAS